MSLARCQHHDSGRITSDFDDSVTRSTLAGMRRVPPRAVGLKARAKATFFRTNLPRLDGTTSCGDYRAAMGDTSRLRLLTSRYLRRRV